MGKYLITGGAGFIGSHFCDSALERKHQVLVFDNFSTGKMEFLKQCLNHSGFKLVEGDIRDLAHLTRVCQDFKPTHIVHLAANADVRRGLERPNRDLEYNTVGTWNIAEASRQANCKNIVFSSTGSVYGEPQVFPTPENCPFPEQTSLYAASKLAGEAILSAYAHGFQMNILTFRFVSILGPRYTHGHVFDFVSSLRNDPNNLEVLGNGKQLKSYLHVEDLIEGIWKALEKHLSGFQVFNIGHDEAMTVDQSVGYIADELKLAPSIKYSGGIRGWVGDSPRIQLDCRRMKELGWTFRHSIEKGVRDTVSYLVKNPFLFESKELSP